MNYTSDNIRNVVLLGHSGSGKTSFSECMLFEAGQINRLGSINDQTMTSDYTNIEKERGNSIFSTLMHTFWKDSKINIIDTPGYDDFVGEVISALKVADTGVIILNAVNGVEVGTELVWDHVNKFQTPGIFIINQIDKDKSDYQTTLDQAIQRFGNKVIPVQYPLNEGGEFDAIVDALRMVVYRFSEGGGKPSKEAIPESEISRAQEMHNALVEVAAENDEGLMEKFFEDGTLNEDELAQGLTIALAQQQFFPVFCCSSTQNMGSGRIMGFINDIAPSPAQRPAAPLQSGDSMACDPSGDPSVFVFKTLSEPKVGMLSYFKVYSGQVSSGQELHNKRTRSGERMAQLFLSNGKNRENIPTLYAGDIGCTVKLKDVQTNDTLGGKTDERQILPIQYPKGRIRTAVTPPSKSEMEKLMKALHQIEMEDPTLVIDQNPQLKQTLLHGQGQLHLDLIKYRIEKVNGITMEFEKPKIPYRETITKLADTSYRHKKQSGGAGQFGEVHMRIEPYHEGMADPASLSVRKVEIEDLPWGGKLAFYWCIVGGSIDSKYSNAIKKGILQKMEEGPLTGSCVQNIRVCIYDGKMHPVDSNDMAFMIASAQAFKEGFKQAGPQILEPIYDLEVLCSDDVMGDIMGDLQTRRSIISGMGAEGHYQKIMAKVPLSELYQYSSSLRSMSQGRAKFTRTFDGYQTVPHDVQKALLAELSAHAEAA